MAQDAARKCGTIGLGTLAFVWGYFIAWLIVLANTRHPNKIQPFVDKDHYILRYFPPREYAILFASLVGLFVLLAPTTFIGLLMIYDSLIARQQANQHSTVHHSHKDST